VNNKIAKILIAENIDWKKTSSDLSTLKKLKEFAKNNNWKIVVSGGYGLDLFLSLTTRTHDDVDIIIYGQETYNEAVEKIKNHITNIFSNAEVTSKPNEFYTEVDINAPGFRANCYFVETIENPFVNHHIIKKVNGEVVTNSKEKFPKPRHGKIGDLEIEIEDQNTHLADILSKISDNFTLKYSQDVENLRHITDPKKVETYLKI
jgi:hypothetical protein